MQAVLSQKCACKEKFQNQCILSAHLAVQREQELGAKRVSPVLSPREELANRWSDNGGTCPHD